MKKLTKRLELTFYMADDYVLTEVYEHESDEKTYINAPYSPEFDEKLCMEIYSWLSLWMDEMEDSDEE